jgi:hypothetical protein
MKFFIVKKLSPIIELRTCSTAGHYSETHLSSPHTDQLRRHSPHSATSIPHTDSVQALASSPHTDTTLRHLNAVHIYRHYSEQTLEPSP